MYSNKVSREGRSTPSQYEGVSVFLRPEAALVQQFELLHVSVFVFHFSDAVDVGVG